MEPEPNGGKPVFGERSFYAVLWLTAAGFVAGPIILWLAGEGSTLGAFISMPLLFLLFLRFVRRDQK